jgi:hypothetical protein
MRDQVTKPQEATQANERLKIKFSWHFFPSPIASKSSLARWKPDADRVLAHILRHRPDTIDALCRLFVPIWRVGRRALLEEIHISPLYRTAGVKVYRKGEIRYAAVPDSVFDVSDPDAKPVGYEAFEQQVGDRAPPRKRIAPPPPRPAPPPPEPEPELKPPPAWLEDGDAPPLTETQRMRRRRQNSEVAILEKIRGRKLDIDRTRLYTGDVLSRELAISEDEYKAIAAQLWGRKKAEFPRSSVRSASTRRSWRRCARNSTAIRSSKGRRRPCSTSSPGARHSSTCYRRRRDG